MERKESQHQPVEEVARPSGDPMAKEHLLALQRAAGVGCMACGAVSGLRKCAKCRSAWYCGAECQKADWKAHKHECAALNAARESASSLVAEEEAADDDDAPMTEERCRALMLRATQLVNKAGGAVRGRGEEEPASNRRLDKLTQAVAIYLRIVAWPGHYDLDMVDHGGAPAPEEPRGEEAPPGGASGLFEVCFQHALVSYAKAFVEVNKSREPAQCREVIRRTLLRLQRYLAACNGEAYNATPGHPEQSAEMLLGEVAMAEGRHEVAAGHFEAALAIFNAGLDLYGAIGADASGARDVMAPAEADIRAAMMRCAHLRDRHDEADEHFAAAVERAPLGEAYRLRMQHLRIMMGHLGEIRERGLALLRSRPGLARARSAADVPADVLETLRKGQADCRRLVEACAADFPAVRAAALEAGDFETWSTCCITDSLFELDNGRIGDPARARELAAGVIRAHTCGGRCHDTVLARQIVAGRGVSFEAAMASGVPLKCACPPCPETWAALRESYSRAPP